MAKKVTTCSCCGSKDLKLVFKDMTDLSYFIDGKFDLIECKRCGLRMTDPLMSEEEFGKYYPADRYYSFNNKITLGHLYHKLSAYYFSRKNFLINILFYPFESLFHKFYISKGKSLLEIGCGDGLKLKIYKKYGLKVAGIEPYGAPLTEKEKNLNIQREFLENVDYLENSFDYIILKESLEHVPDQKSLVKKCLKWVKPSGKVLITIPNTNGVWAKYFGRNWFGYDITRHPYHYNPKNINYFLKSVGFRKVKVRPYDPPYMLGGSLKYKYNKPFFVNSKIINIALVPISLIVNLLGRGSLMEIEASK